jgi:hypothetical protein
VTSEEEEKEEDVHMVTQNWCCGHSTQLTTLDESCLNMLYNTDCFTSGLQQIDNQ